MKCRIVSGARPETEQPCPGAYRETLNGGQPAWFLDFGSLEAFRQFIGDQGASTYGVRVEHNLRKWGLTITLHV